MPPAHAAIAASPVDAFLAFVADDAFPCVGARLALSGGSLATRAAGRFGDARHDAGMHDAITALARDVDLAEPDDPRVHTLAVVFDAPAHLAEPEFEDTLFATLQRLHQLDLRRGHAWADGVGADPDAPDFALSLAGHPFFVVGMHPHASRVARRTPSPVLVFNSHRQFARLRGDGRFEKMQAATRERDLALQGSLNPELAAHGEAPETRQYSGRALPAGWRCPFRRQTR